MVRIDRARFGANLQQLRTRRGYSRWALAEGLGITTTHVKRWEDGAYLPGLDSMVGLCAALDCTPDDLLDGAVLVDDPETTDPERKVG